MGNARSAVGCTPLRRTPHHSRHLGCKLRKANNDEAIRLALHLLKLNLDKRADGYSIFFKKHRDPQEIVIVDVDGREL
jgi:hypothetical protein